MSTQPILTTERLTLRPLRLEDAADVQRLAGAREIAAMMTSIPHPYEDGVAEAWIASLDAVVATGREVHFAIARKDTDALIGVGGLIGITPGHMAEIGYWVGLPYWKQGYCTEAAGAMVRYAFETLGLRRIHGCCSGNNRASARVMEKIGMKPEGIRRQHREKWGQYYDVLLYGILREEYVR